MEGLEQLEHCVDGLLATTGPVGRKRVALEIGRAIRRSQIARIRANLNPDGSAMEPRIPRLRQSRKRVKKRLEERRSPRTSKTGKMFKKLPNQIRTFADENGVEIGLSGSAAGRIARVHQFGLRDRVSHKPGAPEVTYAQRQLLGLTEAERHQILEIVVAALER